MELFINNKHLNKFIGDKIDEFGKLLSSSGEGFIDFVKDPVLKAKLEMMQDFLNDLIKYRTDFSEADFELFPVTQEELQKERKELQDLVANAFEKQVESIMKTPFMKIETEEQYKTSKQAIKDYELEKRKDFSVRMEAFRKDFREYFDSFKYNKESYFLITGAGNRDEDFMTAYIQLDEEIWDECYNGEYDEKIEELNKKHSVNFKVDSCHYGK